MAGSEGIVIDLDPVAVRVLQVDLFDIVGSELWIGAVLRPVAIFDMSLLEVLQEWLHSGNAESQMYINVMGNHLFGAGYHMQLTMIGYLEPDMFTVMKGFGYFLQTQDILIEAGAFIQVDYKDGGMAQMDTLRAGRKAYQDGSGQYKEIAAKEDG